MRRPIQILEPSVAEKIAAGEVIERPASVVKELIENALDAGSTRIQVKLENGGKTLIEVTDNGFGMNAEDLELCVKRHATSKVRSLQELEQVSTLGFRGEALPSIAAVSDLEIISREQNASQSFCYNQNKVEKVTFGHFLGSEHGSRVRVSSLFSTLPARLKFLKSSSAETSQVRDWMERLALAYPNTGFKLLSEEKIIFSVDPEERLSRIQNILGDQDYSLPWVTDVLEEACGRFEIYWLKGLSFSQLKKVVQVVNHRVVKDRLLQQALLNSFRQTLLPGQFPAVLLYAFVPQDHLDVNVHPTKTEVRFLESSRVFQAVQTLTRRLLEKEGHPQLATTKELPAQPSSQSDYSGRSYLHRTNFIGELNSLGQRPDDFFLNLHQTPLRHQTPLGYQALLPAIETLFQESIYKGVFFKTYLVWESRGELLLIDQHAAHERIRFEKLKEEVLTHSTQSQALLIPEVIPFNEEKKTFTQNFPNVLAKLGFEVEILDRSFIFRGIPSLWGDENLRPRLHNLVERYFDLAQDGVEFSQDLDEELFEKLASQACRSSVRAGDSLNETQALSLLESLKRVKNPWNCPHGRPTIVRLEQTRFEEWFSRKL